MSPGVFVIIRPLLQISRSLSGEKGLSVVTISDFLKIRQETAGLKRLYSGSWINADFKIWIGHQEKNKAWEYLAHARESLVEYEGNHPEEKDKLKLAWKLIYLLEGSDWNWWFGDDHTSANDEEFDRLFRSQLSYLYELLNKEPPEYLSFPIRVEKEIVFPEPTSLLSPILDGKDTHYYEWVTACHLDVNKSGGTMHRAESILSHIYYGFDLKNFFLRLDLKPQPEGEYSDISLE